MLVKYLYNNSMKLITRVRFHTQTITNVTNTITDIERVSNRLLKSASSFDKSTKSSIKVFHLQEIGRLASKSRHPLFDERLHTLISQINLDLHILSPAQLVAVAIGYRNIGFCRKSYWSKLCYEVYRHAKSHTSGITGITRSQVSMILGCYASLFTDPLKQTNDLLRWITFDVGYLNEYDYAYITYYMYRTKMSNNSEDEFNIKCLKAITMGYMEKLHLFSPQSLTCILSNYSKMALLPWHIIFRTNNLLKSKVSKLGYKALAIHLRSLMNIKLRDLGILHKISKRLSKDRRLSWIPSLELSTIIYSLGRLAYRNRALLKSLIDTTERSIFVMNDADLMRTIHGFSNLGVATPSLWENISSILMKRIESQSPQHLSIIASSFGKVGLFFPELFDSIKNKFTQLSNGFTSRQIIALLDSSVILGYYDKDFINQLLNCYLQLHDEVPDFIESQLNRIAYSILLEAPEILKNATNPIQTFIVNHSNTDFEESKSVDFDNELGRFIMDLQVGNRIGENMKLNVRIGIYKVHIHDGKNIIDFLSKGQLCPMNEVLLGPSRLKSRHMELLGYNYRTINRSYWNSLSDGDKLSMIEDRLVFSN